MADELDRIFEQRDVERIAPTHGFVVEGRDNVARQHAQLRHALRTTTSGDGGERDIDWVAQLGELAVRRCLAGLASKIPRTLWSMSSDIGSFRPLSKAHARPAQRPKILRGR